WWVVTRARSSGRTRPGPSTSPRSPAAAPRRRTPPGSGSGRRSPSCPPRVRPPPPARPRGSRLRPVPRSPPVTCRRAHPPPVRIARAQPRAPLRAQRRPRPRRPRRATHRVRKVHPARTAPRAGTPPRARTPRARTPPRARTVPIRTSPRARTTLRARTTPLARTRSEPHQEHTTRRTPAPAAAGRGGPSSRAVRAGCGSGRVGRGLEDLDREGLPVGGRVVDGVADLRAVDRGAQRRLRGEHLERVVAVGDLAVAQQEGALLAGHGDLHDHAGLDDAVVLRGLADHGVLQEPLEVRDARFQLALLLAGGVVAAVLLEVPFVASRGDALGDLGASRALELLELLGQAVVRFLGEPGAIRLAAHGVTPVVLDSAQGSEQPPIRESRGTCPHAPRVRVMMIGTMPVPEHFTPRTRPSPGPDTDFAHRVIVDRASAPQP